MGLMRRSAEVDPVGQILPNVLPNWPRCFELVPSLCVASSGREGRKVFAGARSAASPAWLLGGVVAGRAACAFGGDRSTLHEDGKIVRSPSGRQLARAARGEPQRGCQALWRPRSRHIRDEVPEPVPRAEVGRGDCWGPDTPRQCAQVSPPAVPKRHPGPPLSSSVAAPRTKLTSRTAPAPETCRPKAVQRRTSSAKPSPVEGWYLGRSRGCETPWEARNLGC